MRKTVLGVLIALLGVSVGFLLWSSNHASDTKHVPAKARAQYADASPGHDGGIGGNLLLQGDPLQELAAAPSDDEDCESCQLPFVPFFGTRAGINCEITYRRADLPDSAYCMTVNPPQHVSMDSDGELSICSDSVECLSDPPYDQPILPFGQSADAGPFNCQSEATGVTCTVDSSGRGFVISGAGIEPVG
ncbi:hypothetical protein [Mycolicibacter nonchromogenicus]|uniref:hypothetical protein n=1 Tax=Mycolicibacter nonchromogenicus TaxID=1782 RepID=UPI000A7EB203|nr:hypothetical protein [Mycolicibacter nonchromogenicus]